MSLVRSLSGKLLELFGRDIVAVGSKSTILKFVGLVSEAKFDPITKYIGLLLSSRLDTVTRIK